MFENNVNPHFKLNFKFIAQSLDSLVKNSIAKSVLFKYTGPAIKGFGLQYLKT